MVSEKLLLPGTVLSTCAVFKPAGIIEEATGDYGVAACFGHRAARGGGGVGDISYGGSGYAWGGGF